MGKCQCCVGLGAPDWHKGDWWKWWIQPAQVANVVSCLKGRCFQTDAHRRAKRFKSCKCYHLHGTHHRDWRPLQCLNVQKIHIDPLLLHYMRLLAFRFCSVWRKWLMAGPSCCKRSCPLSPRNPLERLMRSMYKDKLVRGFLQHSDTGKLRRGSEIFSRLMFYYWVF